MPPFVQSLALACFLSLASAAATAADPAASRYYEDALKRYEKNDLAGAIIQLKNALQADNRMLAAHVLMGRVSQANGDLPAAEAAYEEALKQGVNRAEVIVSLGQVYLVQGKYEILLDRITAAGLPPTLQADVLVVRANAQAERGSITAATKSLDEALTVAPQSVAVRLAQATLFIRRGDLARATAITDEALKLAPEDGGAWNTRASILHVKGNLSGALAAYAKAITSNPKFIDARVARAGLLIDLGRTDEAERDVAELLKFSPREPRAAYLRSVIAGNRGDLAAMKESLTEITKLLDPVPPNILTANRQMLFLAGLAHFGLGNQEKAFDYLSVYLRQYPGDPGATKLLASIHLERNDRTRAISLLEPLLHASPNDVRAMALLANAYMQERNYRQASALLEQAVRLSGGDGEMRTQLGLSLLGAGKAEVGLENLQQAFAKDPKQSKAGLALATLHLRNGQPKRALEVIEKLVKAEPENLTALNMLGIVRVAAGDRNGGRKAYEQVLSKDAGYLAASLNLARLDAAEGNPNTARQHLQQVLRTDAKNVESMIELAAIEEQAGNRKEAVRWLEKARDEPKGAVRAGILLAQFHQRTGNPNEALAVAKMTVAKEPENLAALATLARANLALGDKRSARQVLEDMTRYANYDSAAQLDIARFQIAADNTSGAMYSLEKALGTRPDWLPALILQADIHIGLQDYAKAEQRIKLIAEKYPASVTANRLAGDLALARGQYGVALGHYNTALRKEANSTLALRVFQAHFRNGELSKGLAFLERWIKDQPKDTDVLRTMGDGYLKLGNLTAARGTYERLLKLRPEDPSIFNNLAQAALLQNDKAALAYAEKANTLQPNSPLYVDTLGWVLVRQGELERGVALLRDARLRDPGNPEIRYHLAVALSKTGRKSEAREEVTQALKSPSAFDGMDDARKLLAELSK